MRNLAWAWLGRTPYDEGHALQRTIRDAATPQDTPAPTLLLLEHEPVITLGRRGEDGGLLVSPHELSARGIELRPTERGGRATYHGPGQLVGYLIARARDLATSLPSLVHGIEGAMLGICATVGVPAHRDSRHRGVWAGEAKIGFVGLAVSHGIVWHGFALNVDPDLAAFGLIRPCGLDDPISSLRAEGGRALAPSAMAQLAAAEVARAFALKPVPISIETTAETTGRNEPRTSAATVSR